MKVRKEGGYSGGKPGTALALGYFDGVHIGHQAVIAAARKAAEAHGLDTAVFTFYAPGATGPKGRRIFTQEQKHRQLELLGVEYCFEPPFSSFKAMEPRRFFEEMLLGGYRAKAVYCGDNFGFGAKRAGNAEMLRQMCAEQGILFATVPMAQWQGAPVSSSRIREALVEGRIPDANAMLGRPYEIDLPVRHGRQLGSTLGFPTINQIFPADMQEPRQGVYITQTLVGDRAYPSATGYGTRPTVDGEGVTCETFIPGFSGDLYDQTIQVRFFKYIQESRRFDSKQQLADAVQDWAAQAREYFASAPAPGAG